MGGDAKQALKDYSVMTGTYWFVVVRIRAAAAC
jgi:hypothetical protein